MSMFIRAFKKYFFESAYKLRVLFFFQDFESGIKKAEIKDLLSRFITQRSKNCPNAAVAWEADLQFVNDYNLDNDPIVRFEQS